MNLSQAAWTSAVKSAGKRAARVTSRQWDRSCGTRMASQCTVQERSLQRDPVPSRGLGLAPRTPAGSPSPPLPPRAHLEVDRIHAQDVGVQLAQLGQGAGDVVDVLDRFAHGGQHLGAVCAQLLRPLVQVEVGEVGLRLWIAVEEPRGEWGREVGVLLGCVGDTQAFALGLWKGAPKNKTKEKTSSQESTILTVFLKIKTNAKQSMLNKTLKF